MTISYGYFPGGDPRHFHPDAECCTEKEITAHKAACEAWDRGEQMECPPGHGELKDAEGRVCGWWHGGAFGIGTYDDGHEDECDNCEGPNEKGVCRNGEPCPYAEQEP